MPNKEKGREAKRAGAVGRRRASLDHPPENADPAKCPGSLVTFVHGGPRIWRWPSGVLPELLSPVLVSECLSLFFLKESSLCL